MGKLKSINLKSLAEEFGVDAYALRKYLEQSVKKEEGRRWIWNPKDPQLETVRSAIKRNKAFILSIQKDREKRKEVREAKAEFVSEYDPQPKPHGKCTFCNFEVKVEKVFWRKSGDGRKQKVALHKCTGCKFWIEEILTL